MEAEKTLEGWAPEPDAEMPLAQIVELAFDYRGNTTVVKRDGTELYGYVFNRDAEAPAPFSRCSTPRAAGPYRVPYAEVRTIHFTGKDTAAGKSYAAWLARKQAEKVGGRPAPGAVTQGVELTRPTRDERVLVVAGLAGGPRVAPAACRRRPRRTLTVRTVGPRATPPRPSRCPSGPPAPAACS